MNMTTTARPAGSLIERTAAVYGLTDLARASRVQPLVAPATPATVDDLALEFGRLHSVCAELVEAPSFLLPNEAGQPFDMNGPNGPDLTHDALAEPVVVAASVPVPPPVQARPVATIDRVALAEAGMIVPGGPAGASAADFAPVARQVLQTARAFPGDPEKAHAILVASARAGDGKTFCAINLALSLAGRDCDVLLIDGDLAGRALMPRLGQPNGPGLLDLLADPALDPAALVVPTDVPGLSLLGAGTRMNRELELLASDRTRLVLERLLADDPRRIVIVDSAPALAGPAASVLARQVGQAVLVVRADATATRDIRDAAAQLDGCGQVRLLLNQVRDRSRGGTRR